jgi:hypothetical protein
VRETSSIAALRSVATMSAAGGIASRSRRVTMPVPAAVSSTRDGSNAATRRAATSAGSANMTGPSPLS